MDEEKTMEQIIALDALDGLFRDMLLCFFVGENRTGKKFTTCCLKKSLYAKFDQL
jgi:hypothetical protein